MKKVKVIDINGNLINFVEVREKPTCFCNEEVYILDSEHSREWTCKNACMSELIPTCTHCGEWVYQDLCYPMDFDDTIGVIVAYGHPHCMAEIAKQAHQK